MGLALATLDDTMHIVDVRAEKRREDLVKVIVDMLPPGQPVLVCVCLDAPLGWPQAMGEELHQHEAALVVGNPMRRRPPEVKAEDAWATS